MSRSYSKWGWVPLGLFVAVMSTLLQFDPADSGERYARPHSEIPCSECHTMTADLDDGGLAVMDLGRQCRGCHEATLAQGADLGLTFHGDGKRRCVECHSFHQLDRVTARGREFLFAYGNQRLRSQCFACHGKGENPAALTEGHIQAARLFHSDFKYLASLTVSQACLICHSENPAQTSELSTTANQAATPRFAVHGSHPTGVRVSTGNGEPGNRIRADIDPRLRLVDGRIECVTCHSLSAQTRYHLAGFENRTELCRGCHDLD